MSAAGHQAIFLSYASQDAAAARRICETLRSAGIEVWFDQNDPLDPLGAHGLVGGDAWDAKIRRQIAECALFVPIISANSQARREGYSRLESIGHSTLARVFACRVDHRVSTPSTPS